MAVVAYDEVADGIVAVLLLLLLLFLGLVCDCLIFVIITNEAFAAAFCEFNCFTAKYTT